MCRIQTGGGQTRHCLLHTGENTQVADGPGSFHFGSDLRPTTLR